MHPSVNTPRLIFKRLANIHISTCVPEDVFYLVFSPANVLSWCVRHSNFKTQSQVGSAFIFWWKLHRGQHLVWLKPWLKRYQAACWWTPHVCWVLLKPLEATSPKCVGKTPFASTGAVFSGSAFLSFLGTRLQLSWWSRDTIGYIYIYGIDVV